MTDAQGLAPKPLFLLFDFRPLSAMAAGVLVSSEAVQVLLHPEKVALQWSAKILTASHLLAL